VNFAVNRNGYFHYTVLPHRYDLTSNSSGQAELPGDDLVVSLYCYGSDQNVANILRECDCEWIVRYKGSYRKDGTIWIVMEVKLGTHTHNLLDLSVKAVRLRATVGEIKAHLFHIARETIGLQYTLDQALPAAEKLAHLAKS